MHATLGRFILLSAAMHMGVLALLSSSPIRPPVLTAALTVSLDALPVAEGAAPGHPHSTTPPTSVPPTSIHRLRAEVPQHIAAAGPLPPAAAARPAQGPTSDIPLSPRERSGAADPAAAAPSDSSAVSQNPAGEPHPEGMASDSPGPPPQPLDTARLGSQLEGLLRAAIAPNFIYPLLARRHGWQGEVQIGLRVEANGRLSHLHITRSSGYRLLDDAALTALNGIANLPGAAGWLEGRHFDMVLPIEYQLTDGQS